jgi:uncharacterized protein
MRSRRTRSIVVQFLILVGVVQLVAPLLLVVLRNRVLFYPSATRPETALGAMRDVDARVVRVTRPDGRALAAYDVAMSGLDADAPVVLFLHGNGGDIAMRAGIAARFAKAARVRLLMLDYSGYGGNDGSPSEDEINADALAAFDHLVAEGVPAARIVVFGESIGGAPALFVANERPVAGVVTQSTLASLSSMALRVYPWLPLGALYVRGAFPNVNRIAAITAPVLVVHGVQDRIVPFSEGERLAAAQPAAEFLRVEAAHHNDLFEVAGDAYLAGLGERFRRWTTR